MNKFNTKTWFVGIDISKDTYDVAIVNKERPKNFLEEKFDNTLKGISSMDRWMKKHKIGIADSLLCMEHTGTYGLMLFAWLSQQEVDFCVEPGLQIKRSLGMTRGKSDKVDARRIATYAFTHKANLKPFIMPAQSLIQIKQLLTFRSQQVKIRTALKNSRKHHQQYAKVSGLINVVKDLEEQINGLTEKIEEAERQIHQIVQSDPELKTNYKLATSVKGIGILIGSLMLVTTNNFTSFDNGRQFACYTGNAPFEYTSGSSINARSKTSNLAHKKMRTLLSQGANNAYKWDPELKSYYDRKIKEGKEHKTIINAISCKLINRVFAVVKRGSPYVITYQQKIA
jgi:transposase